MDPKHNLLAEETASQTYNYNGTVNDGIFKTYVSG